ncbi:MAG: protoporphyrinogen oxidase [Thermus sp.]|uniref:protoporphyrinogen oxidase n=1 Tax=Thermus sp. TaxID=275 RepID=UPI0025FEDB63|nr:protoporphyrinogen oxidase [Thermus sp.]MCS6869785.1 protoporphyrinogen oxidase [Thermus sp.]MCS7217709.1 protoporphyrinogen oxidase [Thermus sp.]MCX7849153.1 protoporphyrinogen oxidase [Thermus sp.]MDW8016229.1 protoporphyrinogen oxidase [Thermus sp.]MDW8356757.1 protoporphyrinogen oxidase [Thermus sp.]
MAQVAVVGGGWAGLAAALALEEAGADFLLLEASPRLGGKVFTHRKDGFLVEGGPDASVRYKREVLELAGRFGLEPLGTLPAKPAAYILRRGRAHPLPEGLLQVVPGDFLGLVRTPLLSLGGKLRALYDLLLPRGRKEDESLRAFVERRLGLEVYEALVAPLAGGIYGGEPDELSMRAAFPQLLALEEKHRSLLLGAMRARRARPSREGGSLFFSFREGLGALTARMAAQVAEKTLLATPVLGVEPLGGRYRLHTPRGTLEAEALILATPAPVAAGLLRPFLPQATALLKGIPHIPAATASLAFREELPVEGHGLLMAKGEGYRVRGFTWTHRKWPGRAPEGFSLVRAYFSGEVARLSEAELVRVALEDLRRHLGQEVRPERTFAFRFPEGMPAYRVGHLERIRGLEMALLQAPGVFLAGNYLEGVGLPEVVRSGQRAAERALGYLALAPKAERL